MIEVKSTEDSREVNGRGKPGDSCGWGSTRAELFAWGAGGGMNATPYRVAICITVQGRVATLDPTGAAPCTRPCALTARRRHLTPCPRHVGSIKFHEREGEPSRGRGARTSGGGPSSSTVLLEPVGVDARNEVPRVHVAVHAARHACLQGDGARIARVCERPAHLRRSSSSSSSSSPPNIPTRSCQGGFRAWARTR